MFFCDKYVATIVLSFIFTLCSALKPREYGNDTKSPVGPPYPITAAFFRGRNSQEEWNKTLGDFKKIGGDTIILPAPKIENRTINEIQNDPSFKDCGSCSEENCSCWNDAQHDLEFLQGLKIAGWLTYDYGEDYSDSVMACRGLDRKYTATSGCATYFRFILPSKSAMASMKGLCDFPKGAEVWVLFTSYGAPECRDPVVPLLHAAVDAGSHVVLGLPGVDTESISTLLPAYTAFVHRVLSDHQHRFSSVPLPQNKTLYSVVAGYYSSNNCSLPQLAREAPGGHVALYTHLGALVGRGGRRLVVSPSVNTNKLEGGGSLDQHLHGMASLTNIGSVGVVAVQEGRGEGQGAYFRARDLTTLINATDPTLARVLEAKGHAGQLTYGDVFTVGNQQLFAALQSSHAGFKKRKSSLQLWLVLQAYEMMTDDPCLPLDPPHPGIALPIDRASKRRMDMGLAAAGGHVARVAAAAWDPDFTCLTTRHNRTLSAEIEADENRPILSDCFFHSPSNLSVVVLGYSLEGMTQGYTVTWRDYANKTHTVSVYGYYFELDYGTAHGLVTSLQYVMLWDIPEMFSRGSPMMPKGEVHVAAAGAAADCWFDYDLTGARA